jgi:hypothetical protein
MFSLLKDIQDRIAFIEQQFPDSLKPLMDAFGQTDPSKGSRPGNTQTKPEGDMPISDMWQLVNLNNRIAAAEAAIQKVAT